MEALTRDFVCWSTCSVCATLQWLGVTGLIATGIAVYGGNLFLQKKLREKKGPDPYGPHKAIDAGQLPKFTGDAIACVNPATGEKLGEDIAPTAEELEECLKKAKVAQKAWRKTSFDERRAVLGDILEYVLHHQDEICQLSVQDTGKTITEAYYGEILTTCEKVRHIIANGESNLQTESRTPPLMMMVKSARVEYYPLGTIGIIIPWNYPFHNAASAIVAAIFSGNAAVLGWEPEYDPHVITEAATKSCLYLLLSSISSRYRKILASRGHDPNLIQILPGYGQTGAQLCASPLVDKILFIGSPATGKKVMAAASQNLTPVILELGGKDPFIVFEDAEFDHAVELAMRGVFINNGQNCLAAERIYVQRSIFDKFKNEVVKRASGLRQGASGKGRCMVDCGAMTMPGQVDIVERLVNEAVEAGATVLVGGKRAEIGGEGDEKTLFFEPTILCDVSQEMSVVREEAFGPIMVLLPFDTDEDVIEMANSSKYGLGCSIFSTDYARAERVGKEIVSGMLTINDFGLSYLIQNLPFGGCKVSGFGRFNGPEGLREFCRQKSVVTDRFPFRTKPPKFTTYPVPDNAPKIIESALIAVYAKNIKERLSAAVQLLKMLMQ